MANNNKNGTNTNLVANYLGTIWSIFSIYFFMPFYIKFLGDEGYGLIMFAVTLQSIIFLLDGGFSATARRELSWGHKNDAYVQRVSSFIKTIEWFYACIFVLLVVFIVISSGWITENWFKFKELTYIEVQYSVILMITIAVCQMQSSLYNGSLLALEFQVLSNTLQFFFNLFKNGFVVFIIALKSTPSAFLLWQLVVIIFYIFIQRYFVFKKIQTFASSPQILTQSKPQWSYFKGAWKLSFMFLALSILSTINLQVDKLFISKLSSIATVGYYNTGYALGQVLVSISGPIATTLSPFLINYFSTKDSKSIEPIFRRFTKFNAILTSAIGVTIAINGYTIVKIWTGSTTFADNASQLVPYMVIAGICLAAQIIPYSLGVASGDLKPIINNSIVNIIISVPSYYLATYHYGIKGTAIVWMISNIFMLVANVYFYLRKTLPDTYKLWLLNDTLLPILTITLFAFGLSLFQFQIESKFLTILQIGLLFILTFGFGLIVFFSADLKKKIKQLYAAPK